MSFQIGQKVIWIDANINPKLSKISYGIVSSIGKDELKIEGLKHPLYSAYIYPNTVECLAHLNKGLEMKIKHEEDENQYMRHTMGLNNSLVKRGLK